MKQKMNARQRREAEALRRKGKQMNPALPDEKRAKPQLQEPAPKPKAIPKPAPPEKTPEEETREFLDYLARENLPVFRDDPLPRQRRKHTAPGTIPKLNLEDGMPLVEEAVSRMKIGIQEMRVSRIRIIKLIHGYGSTGRGGKIRTGVRSELAGMKRRKLIRDWIPGEDFGPTDPASRRLAELDGTVVRDPDYGRMNHGISIAVL